MKSIKIFILFFAFSQGVIGQNKCGNFIDYEDSQNWIKKVKALEPKKRKIEILKRIECEQKSEYNDIDFWTTILFEGTIISTANDIPTDQNEILRLIPAKNFNLLQSLCESKGIYPSRCNLGFVLIDGIDKLILNEITELKNIQLKKRKGKRVIKLESGIENDIEFELNHFLQGHSTGLIVKTELKKGRNRFVFRRSNNLQLLEVKVNGKKLIIII